MNQKQLTEFLKRHELSPGMLADILGVTEPAVNHWLKGIRGVSKTVTRLLKMFDKYPKLMEEFGQ